MQTSYNRYMARGFAGMLADSGPADILSFFNAEESASLPFGIAVQRSTAADDAAQLLADGAAASAIIGVTVHQQIFEQPLPGDDETPGTKPTCQLPVARKARVLVTVEDAVTPESGVYVRHTAGVGEQKGAFRGTADSTDTVQLTNGFKFLTSAGAGELAVLEVNLP